MRAGRSLPPRPVAPAVGDRPSIGDRTGNHQSQSHPARDGPTEPSDPDRRGSAQASVFRPFMRRPSGTAPQRPVRARAALTSETPSGATSEDPSGATVRTRRHDRLRPQPADGERQSPQPIACGRVTAMARAWPRARLGRRQAGPRGSRAPPRSPSRCGRLVGLGKWPPAGHRAATSVPSAQGSGRALAFGLAHPGPLARTTRASWTVRGCQNRGRAGSRTGRRAGLAQPRCPPWARHLRGNMIFAVRTRRRRHGRLTRPLDRAAPDLARLSPCSC